MTFIHSLKIGLACSGALIASVAVAQEAPPKEKLCRACHGEAGAAPITAVYPKLNGQNKEYLVSSLKSYRAGQRQGGLAVAMVAQAAKLTDEEIDALAAYYAAQ